MSSTTSSHTTLNKSRIALFCIALWVSAWVDCYQTAELVVVNEMYIAFPGQEGVVTAFVSWPMFAVAAGAILAGVLYNASVACGVYLFDACSTVMGSLTSSLVIAVGLLVASLVVEIVVQLVEAGRNKSRESV